MENNLQNQSQVVENMPNGKEDEIDLLEIIQKLWRNRKFILKVAAIFSVLGFIVIVSTPIYFTASCTLMPQTVANNSGGSLSGLAAMAGINIGNLNSGNVLSPVVYPKIMSNVNFQKELMYSKLRFKEAKQSITLYDYYSDPKYQKFNLLECFRKYTIGLPGIIIGKFKSIFLTYKSKDESVLVQKNSSNDFESIQIQVLTETEENVSNAINSHLLLNINSKEGFIVLSSKMPEPLAAAELVQKGLELLQKYITQFKIEKVIVNLEFINKSYEEAKKNFEAKQEELARFRDSNKNFTSAVAKTHEEKLLSEYTLLLGIYTELAKQKEQAKIAVTETTPILTVIEPIVIPIYKDKSNRFIKFFIYTFFGFIVGVGVVLCVSYLEENFIPNIKKYRFIPKIV